MKKIAAVVIAALLIVSTAFAAVDMPSERIEIREAGISVIIPAGMNIPEITDADRYSGVIWVAEISEEDYDSFYLQVDEMENEYDSMEDFAADIYDEDSGYTVKKASINGMDMIVISETDEEMCVGAMFTLGNGTIYEFDCFYGSEENLAAAEAIINSITRL